MEINVSKLQMILNRVVGKRKCVYGHRNTLHNINDLIDNIIYHYFVILSYILHDSSI